MSILDYMDKMTGNPISYNFYIQQTDVAIDTTIFINPIVNTTSYFTISTIEIDTLDTSIKSSATVTFKLNPSKTTITIQYANFSDCLGVFGGFYSVFSLIAGLLSGLYSNFFYSADLVNAVFKFTGNSNPNNANSMKKVYNKVNVIKTTPNNVGMPPKNF